MAEPDAPGSVDLPDPHFPADPASLDPLYLDPLTIDPAVVFDGHNDTLLEVDLAPGWEPDEGVGQPAQARTRKRSFFERSAAGHIDLSRAREGRLGGGLFAIFVPAPSLAGVDTTGSGTPSQEAIERATAMIDTAYAQRSTISSLAGLLRLEAASAGEMRIARSVAEVVDCLATGTLAAVIHFEGAEAIDPDLDALAVFHAAGLRSLGIVWSRPNAFAAGVPFGFPGSPDTGPGLTERGRALVRACNQLGIVLDLAHLNEKGFWDVARQTGAPLVVSHTGVHAICPTTRNLTDAQIDAVGESGGLVGISFVASFLRPDGQRDANTPIAVIIEHIRYVVDRIGIDRVGIGSDFDGALIPAELGDAAGLPRLVAALRASGFDDAALGKVTHWNWLRVFGQTWKPGPPPRAG